MDYIIYSTDTARIVHDEWDAKEANSFSYENHSCACLVAAHHPVIGIYHRDTDTLCRESFSRIAKMNFYHGQY